MYSITFTPEELTEMETNDKIILSGCVSISSHRRY